MSKNIFEISSRSNEVKVDSGELYEKIQLYKKLKEDSEKLKDQLDLVSKEIKEVGKEKWSSLYEEIGVNPGSIIIIAEHDFNEESIMYVPSDKYISIDGKKILLLKEKYGDEIIDEVKVYKISSEMIEKYSDIISDLINNCDLIDDKDKSKIIKADVTFSVAKGSIDKINEYGQVKEVFDDILPVVSLKLS